MKLLKLSILFLTIISILYSCTTFKPLVSRQKTINGTFKAHFKNNTFKGFFSITQNKMLIDLINPLGMIAYGIFVNNNNVILKNYTTGKTYTQLMINHTNLSIYKNELVYMQKHFETLCLHNTSSHIIVLMCKTIGNSTLPLSLLFTSQTANLRIDITNMQIKTHR